MYFTSAWRPTGNCAAMISSSGMLPDLVAVDLGDEVGRLQLGARGGRAGIDAGQQRAFARAEAELGDDALVHARGKRDAEEAAHGRPALEQAADGVAQQVAGQGEADSAVGAGGRGDLHVDADELAMDVDERAAGVAGIDGRVGLQVILEAGAGLGNVAAGGADDAAAGRFARGRTDCRWRRPVRRRAPCRNRPMAAA